MLVDRNFFEKKDALDISLIPKIELHVHLEGTITPSLIKELSEEYKIPIPPDLIHSDKNQFLWNGFDDFLTKYDDATKFICSKEALTRITYAYLKKSANHGCIYSELTVSPDHMAQHQMSYQDTIDAVVSGIKQAKKDFDIDARILIVLVRHLGRQRCEDLVDTILANPNEYVVGMGLAGNEKLFPPYMFENAFKKAKKGHLKLTAHAGEWTNAKDVLNAIHLLGVTRIGHGIHAAFDEEVMDEILKHGIHLELCPTSNHSLETHYHYPDAFKHLFHPEHPLSILHKKGIRYSLNTDDPPFFNNATLLTEYAYTAKLLGLSREDLLRITLTAIEDSFADDDLKIELRKKALNFSDKNVISDSKDISQQEKILRFS